MGNARKLCTWALFASVLCGNGIFVQACEGAELPRKAAVDESYPGVRVGYDAIRDAQGRMLRIISTAPDSGGPKFATVFLVGWLSCDTVEAPPGTKDSTQLLFQALATLPGFATVRLEKAGVGDSEGDCAASDFTSELEGYRVAFRHLKDYPFVDSDRIFLLGISNGGGFAPLVAQGAQVRGYVVDGGWIKTWYEHMLEIERRRLALSGVAPSALNARMKDVEALYSAYLLEKLPPREVFARHPDLRALWEGPVELQYGRPVAYYQQLQDLDLMAAWSGVHSPVLALHGEYDWIMSREDFELLVALVNRGTPGAAEFVELPRTGHSFDRFDSLLGAFHWERRPFDEAVARRVCDWLEGHRR